MTEPQPPDWVRDAIFYQIFPDRFAQSLTVPKPAGLDAWGATPTRHGYQGGDLIGVVEKLDYLCDLGINAIYFTPIFQSASNHRYHTHDYHQVDPMLGGNAALRRLIDEAHARGIRVVLDGVFNHASRGFFQFHDVLENGQDSAYLDWFTIRSFPLYAYDPEKAHGYGSWAGLPALPKFNVRTPAVREFLLNVARVWVDFGIDGWRLDVANEIDDDDFWREFRRRVRSVNPEAYIVGEVWHAAARWLQGDMWDAVMNYWFTFACISFFIGDAVNLAELRWTCLGDGTVERYRERRPGAEAFARTIDEMRSHYHPDVNAAMLNLLDSHDMARFVNLAGGDRSAFRLATLFQLTYPGPPSIYYGDEVGMSGGHDPLNRRAFCWNSADWDTALLHDVQRWIALRKSRASLRRGTYQSVYAKDDVHVHLRRLGDDSVVVALNAARQTKHINVPLPFLDGTVLEEAWTHDTERIENGWLLDLRLKPRSGRVWMTRLSR